MSFKDVIKNKKQMIGTWCIIPSPEVVNVLCKSGLDFVLVDFEHSPVNFETAQKMVMAAHAEQKYAISRVGKLEEVEILRSLDIGSDGIIVPHIESLNDVNQCLEYIKYFPEGNRGYSPYTRAGGYCVNADYTKKANKNIRLVINLETPEEEIIDRIVNRRVCSNQDCKAVYNVKLNPSKVENVCDKCGSKLIQRKDDNEETIKSRLNSYYKETAPIVDYYDKKGVLYSSEVSIKINKMAVDVADEVYDMLTK